MIGGGLSAAYPMFIDAVLAEMNGTIESCTGQKLPRIVQKCFDLENPEQRQQFITGQVKSIQVPGTQTTLLYDALKRVGIGRSVLKPVEPYRWARIRPCGQSTDQQK